MIEALDDTLKQIDKIEAAIAKYTNALNAHDMSRRHTVSENRNALAGEVYEARKALETILSRSRDMIQAAKAEEETQRLHLWNDAVEACDKVACAEVDAIEAEADNGWPSPARTVVRAIGKVRKPGDRRGVTVLAFTADDFPSPDTTQL